MLTFADDLRQDESAIQLICFRSYNPDTWTPKHTHTGPTSLPGISTVVFKSPTVIFLSSYAALGHAILNLHVVVRSATADHLLYNTHRAEPIRQCRQSDYCEVLSDLRV